MFHKYVRTPHIQGSRFQHGDYDLEAVPWAELTDKQLVVEEKMDGANAGVSFEDGKLMIQSRGHYLRGGPREKHFSILKQWAATRETELYTALGDKYVMFGEWMLAKHTCFYDLLPHYFMEFDLYDKSTGEYLSTDARQSFYKKAGVTDIISSVLVLESKQFKSVDELRSQIVRSHFKSATWYDSLFDAAIRAGVPFNVAKDHTDPSSDMEGIYVKWEEAGLVKGRYKFVRGSFTNSIMDQEEHWLNRPIIMNTLAEGADARMFG